MDKYREKVAHRGTTDCPFQQYHMVRTTPNVVLTSTHWHPEYEIIYMEAGSIELKSDKHTDVLHADDIAFIQPEWLHSIKPLEENTSYYAFVFSLDLLTLPHSHFFQKEVITPIAVRTHQFTNIVRSTDVHHSKIQQELNNVIRCPKEAANRKSVIFTSMLHIFLDMADTLHLCPKQKKHSNETIKLILQYLTEHYAEHVTLQEVSEHVHLHPNYLCALLKDYTGQTLFQHLNRIRIDMAAELLKDGLISVSDTASICGFDSIGYFTRKFREHIGMPPKEYSLKYK